MPCAPLRMAFMKMVASWSMMVSSRFSFCVFMPSGRTPIMATRANPMTARLMAISIMVNALRGVVREA